MVFCAYFSNVYIKYGMQVRLQYFLQTEKKAKYSRWAFDFTTDSNSTALLFDPFCEWHSKEYFV